MGNTQEFGPLLVDLQAHEVVLRFLAAQDIYLAVPPSLGDDLAAMVAGNAADFQGKTMVFDLTGTGALRSRHLGILVSPKLTISRPQQTPRFSAGRVYRLQEILQPNHGKAV